MRRGLAFIAATIACAAAPALTQADRSAVYPENTVLLLVASWCAPCHAELAQLDAIAQAAAPFAVRVMLADDSRSSRRMVAHLSPQRQWIPDPGSTAAKRADLLARTPGLPYAVVIGPNGRPCADHRGGLDAARVRTLIARCRRRD